MEWNGHILPGSSISTLPPWDMWGGGIASFPGVRVGSGEGDEKDRKRRKLLNGGFFFLLFFFIRIFFFSYLPNFSSRFRYATARRRPLTYPDRDRVVCCLTGCTVYIYFGTPSGYLRYVCMYIEPSKAAYQICEFAPLYVIVPVEASKAFGGFHASPAMPPTGVGIPHANMPCHAMPWYAVWMEEPRRESGRGGLCGN